MTTEGIDIKELAAGVAADIRKYGHYQDAGGNEPVYEPYYAKLPVKCCVLHNPHVMMNNDHESTVRMDAMAEALGMRNSFEVPDWNDSTPTEEVLAALDAIAAGN